MEMDTAENKRFLVKLSMLARECGAGPTEMFVTLVQAVFADEAMTDTRLAEFCGISRTTLHRMKVDREKRLERLVTGMKKEDFLAPREKAGGMVSGDVAVEAVSVPASTFVEGGMIESSCEVLQGDSRGFKTVSENADQPLADFGAKNEHSGELHSNEAAKVKRSQDCLTEGELVELFFDLYEPVYRVKRDRRGMLIVELRKCAEMGYTLRGVIEILEDCFASEVWKTSPAKIPTPSSFIDWLIQLAQGADGEKAPTEAWRQISRSIQRLRG